MRHANAMCIPHGQTPEAYSGQNLESQDLATLYSLNSLLYRKLCQMAFETTL